MTGVAAARGRQRGGYHLRSWMVQAALALALAALASLVAVRSIVAAEAAVAAGTSILMASGVALVLRDKHDDNQV
jgi:uncharacterized membrane protein